jgi:ribonuclease J
VNSSIRFVALGGLGEVGMNCTLFECGKTRLLIDCGVTFSGREQGVDLVHPDFGILLSKPEPPAALFITHGHEDHIGAVPYLLRCMKIPIYGPAYALALIRNRCEQLGVEEPELNVLTPGQRTRVGPFEIEAVRVTHSIPDTLCLVLRTPAGAVVHSGDFKMDPDPPDELYFDRERLEAIGREGVRLLLSDSTNVEVKGLAGSERSVAAALKERIAQIKGRAVVSLFGSNVHRLKAVFEAARVNDRKVILLGQAIRAHYKIAGELGLLDGPLPEFIWPEHAHSTPRENLLIVATGTQGEPRAALSRLSSGVHEQLRLEPGDEVILSSRVIPGNERAVLDIIEKLEKAGVRVWHRGVDEDLHVSGHACSEEQQKLIELLRPQGFMPIHGSYHYLSRHADLAREMGVPEVVVVGNGTWVEVDDKSVKTAENAAVGRVYLQSDRELDESVLRERKLLSEVGAVLVSLAVSADGKVIAGPEVGTLGVKPDVNGRSFLAAARQHLGKALANLAQPATDLALREQLTQSTRAFFSNAVGYKPVVLISVVRVEV